MSILRARVIEPLRSGRTWRHLAFLLSAIVLGTAWLVLLITSWALGIGLLITLLGIPVLIGLTHVVRLAIGLEGVLAGALLGVRLPPAGRPVGEGRPILRDLWNWLRSPRAWREQAYLLLRFVAGLPLAVVVIAVIGAGGQLLAYPAYYWVGEGIDLGFMHVDTLGEALVAALLGAVVLVASVPLVEGAAVVWRGIARGVLGTGDPARGRPARQRAAGSSRAERRLAIHTAVWAVIVGACILIWALTTPSGYFWPIWVILPLGLELGVHAAFVFRPPDPQGGRRRALELHALTVGLIMLFFTAIWAVTTPGGYYWPAWVAVALAIPLGIHAGSVLSRRGDRQEMAERIDVLTATRAGAVDQQAAELRRIERDLHDGAQARLVALAMDLGMARERLGADPEARELVAGAHEQAKQALSELRDLARGIHPVVLTDRGLPAALATLAGHSRIPVELQVETGERPAAAVEAAAYFVVAEALTNANKHSGAERVRVDVARRGDVMRVRVSDDGSGGADPGGEGLRGLRHRVEALDGTMSMTSATGAGTVLAVELPCGS